MHYSIAVVTESLPTYDDIADKLAPFQEYDGCTTPDMVLEAVQNDKREHFLEHYNEVRPFYINGDKISFIWYGGISELNTLTKEHRQRLQGFNDIFVKVLFSDVPDDITEQDFVAKYYRFHNADQSTFTFSKLVNLGNGYRMDHRYYDVIKDNLKVAAPSEIWSNEIEFAKDFYDLPPCPDNKIPTHPGAEYISGFVATDSENRFLGDYYWRNINGHWDWWVIGGRWKNSLKRMTAAGMHEDDSMRIRDIDLKLMELETKHAVLTEHIANIKGISMRTEKSISEIYDAWNSPEALAARKDQSRDTWREMCMVHRFHWFWYRDELGSHELPDPGSNALAYGYIDQGKWVSRDTENLWRNEDSNREKWEAMFFEWYDGLNPDHYITIVDIHI